MGYIVTTRDNITINGVSARYVGLCANMPQPVPPAKQRYTAYNVGGDTDFVDVDDSYENVSYTVSLRRLLQPQDLRGGDVYAWLAGANRLELTRNPGRYYRVQAVDAVDPTAPEQLRGQEVGFRITFLLAPFAYHTENTPVTMGLDPEIINPGTRYSRPLYKITHSGTGCNLVVNGEILTVKPWTSKNGLTTLPPSPIWIDAERMVAYTISGTDMINATKYTDGAFPFLNPGRNTAYTTGDSLEITGNWRDY